MTITRKGSLIPRVSLGSSGAEIKVVLTLSPMISKTLELMSLSVILLIYPFLVSLLQIYKGFDPKE